MTFRRQDTIVLLGPAVLLVGVIFLLPLCYFLFSTLGLHSAGQAWEIVRSPAMLSATLTTGYISLTTTLVVLLVGYPLAYGLLRARGIWASVIICCIVLPHFTSIIVRTYGWMVLLERNGLISRALVAAGLSGVPVSLMYNRAAVIVGLGYVLLPYMVLCVYSSMRAIDPQLVNVSTSLGAGTFYTFRRIFLPLTAPGVYGGVLLVFVLAVGSFVTPTLMGGPRDIMIGMFIEQRVEMANDWPVAAAMSAWLLIVTAVLFSLYFRLSISRKGER